MLRSLHRCVVVLFAAACLILAPPGCTMGPSVELVDAGSKTGNDGKNVVRSVYTDADGNPVSWQAVTTGPTSEIQQDETGVVGNYAGAIPNSGTIFLPARPVIGKDGKALVDKDGNVVLGQPESISFVAASNMDMSIGKLVRPDGTVIENFTWAVRPSETIRALNEALDRFKEIWPKLSEEQRKALESAVNGIAPGLFEVLKSLATGLVASKDAKVSPGDATRVRDLLARSGGP